MTISTSVNKVVAQGNGATTAFSFSFLLPLASNAVVTVTDASGIPTVLASTQYSLSGVGNPNGGVLNYPLSGSPLAVGWSISLQRILPLQQLTSLVNQSAYYPQVVEGGLDQLEMQIQQIAASTGGNTSLQFPGADPLTLNAILPPAAARANKLASFDSFGNVTAVAASSQDATSVSISLANYISQLATSIGSSLIGFIQAGAGAVLRTLQTELRDVVKVKQFGAVNDGVTDGTPAFNYATLAIASYSTAVYRKINTGAGVLVLGAASASVYIRKGQHLQGDGMGATVIDVSTRGANTAPIIVLGTDSSGNVDGGGQVAEVSSMEMLGGPASFANIDTTACAGWSIHDVLFSSPGIGITAGGGDAFVSHCIFDDGLTGISIVGGNINLNNSLFYLCNFQITIGSNAHDIRINGVQSEYAKFCGILLSTGATGISNIKVENYTCLQNQQFGTFLGGIFIASSGADLSVISSMFRNLNGYAIKYSTGVGNVLVVEDSIFDGNKTVAAYAQSTTMSGIDVSNMDSTVSGCVLRNLPGQPILFGGALAVTVVLDGLRFSSNTGGTTEVLINNSNSGSKLIIRNCIGSGRPLINDQSTVQVIYENNVDGQNAETVTVTAATSTVAVSTQSVIANRAGTVTLTLPSASIYPNRVIDVRTVTANTVVSASSNVVPLAGGAAGTALLTATTGKWARLRSDGTNWQVMSGN